MLEAIFPKFAVITEKALLPMPKERESEGQIEETKRMSEEVVVVATWEWRLRGKQEKDNGIFYVLRRILKWARNLILSKWRSQIIGL